MKSPLPYFGALAGAALLALVAAPVSSSGQAGASEDEAVAALIIEITNQQAALAENQTKLDEKLAQIAEEIRIARLHVARGGGNPRSNP